MSSATNSGVRDATALIACERVSVSYGEGAARVSALDNFDLVVEAGQRVALWGPSGSGKTTVLYVLGGLVVPNEGRVLWQRGELSSLEDAARTEARARGIAYVFQGSNLLDHFTAFENVAFAYDASRQSGEAGTSASHGASPEDLLALVGLTSKLDALGNELSGGEAQRVAIARALAQSPALLLCDEPTGHLDSDTASRVLDMIEQLQREFGFALVVATHDAAVAARAERVVELADGRAVAVASA